MTKKQAVELLSSTIFSLNKRITPSNGTFYGSVWDNRNTSQEPLKIIDKTVRGTMSHHVNKAATGNPLKLQNTEIEKANIQRIDDCFLSPTQDTLIVKFSVNFLPLIDGLEACNNAQYAEKYRMFLESYANDLTFGELAKRYAFNIASGRFLWKNKVGAEKIEVTVSIQERDAEPEHFIFDAFGVGSIDSTASAIEGLSNIIEQALAGKKDYALLYVTAAVKRGLGQVVFPSQEFVQDKSNNKEAKGKHLYSINGIAAMHDQKIGNALRTIDTWYNDFPDFNRPIPVEVYGSITNLSTAFRPPYSKTDYHSLMKKMTSDIELSHDEKHYLVAMMIRGGVLGTEK